MRLIKSVSISLITKAVGFVLTFLTSIIIARYLGPSGKGIFAILTTITGIALQFGNFGFHASSTYFAIKDKDQIPSIAGNLIVFGLTIGITSSLAILALSLVFPKEVLGNVPYLFLIVMLVSLPFAFIAQFLQNLLLGMQRIYEYNFTDLVARFIMLLAVILLFIVFGKGVYELIIISTAIAVLTNLSYIVFVRRQTPILMKLDYTLLKSMFSYGFNAYIAALFAFLVIRSDMLLVNYFLGTRGAGLYSLAVSFADWLLLIPVTVAAMLFPKATAIGDKKSELTKKVSRHTVITMAFVCVIAAVLAKPVIVFLYTEAFAPSAAAFIWLVPGIFFLSLETIYMQDFAARGMPPIVYISPALGLLANIALNVILIPRFGIIAASATSSTAYFLMFLVNIIYFKNISMSSYRDILIVRRTELNEIWRIYRDRILVLKTD